MKPSLFYYLALASVLVSTALCASTHSTDQYSYDSDEDADGGTVGHHGDDGQHDDEYSYADYGEGDDDHPQPALNPQFVTEPQTFKVEPGHTIRLPCLVDRLGPMIIVWKRRPTDSTGGFMYLSTGTHMMTDDPRIAIDAVANDQGDVVVATQGRAGPTIRGSTLVITLATPADMGQYVCEVSSNPPIALKHEVSIIVPPTVKILKPQHSSRPNSTSSEVRLNAGEDLALVCRGSGDPAPSIKWTRLKKRMPDGRTFVEGEQVVYTDVTRKHSGTYICMGSNGPGKTAEDSVKVNVLHAPEIITEESYVTKDSGVQLELVCVVQASPAAAVSWYKNGHLLELEGHQGQEGDQVESASEESEESSFSSPSMTWTRSSDGRVSIGHAGHKHVLLVPQVSEDDHGIYTCHANNHIGEAKGNIKVMGSIDTGPNDNLFLVEDTQTSERNQEAMSDTADSTAATHTSSADHSLHASFAVFVLSLCYTISVQF